MEVTWRQRQWQGYIRDARAAKVRFAGGERDPAFLLRTLTLLRTFSDSLHVDTEAQMAVEVMVQLAVALHAHLHYWGYWQEIVTIWTQLIEVLKETPDAVLYAEAVKLLAISASHQGEHGQALALYDRIIGSGGFSRLPPPVQADLLVNAGTCHAWHSDPRRARSFLRQALTITEKPASRATHHRLVDQCGVRSPAFGPPLWELRAYALNQLGSLALFRGCFHEAAHLYQECCNLFLTHGEGDNLACVAYQALGRLWLYSGRHVAAISLLERGLAIRRRWQDKENTALNAVYLAAAYIGVNNLGQAECLLSEALAICAELQVQSIAALCHLYFGELLLCRGDPHAALGQWREALRILRQEQTPVVEQRILVRRLPWLLRSGQWRLAVAIIRQLAASTRYQRLAAWATWRLIRRLCWHEPAPPELRQPML